MDRSARLVERLDRLLGASQFDYLEHLYEQFVSRLEVVVVGRPPHEVFEEAIAKLYEIQQALEQCSGLVLQVAGTGPELGSINVEVRRVHDIVQHVEMMFCEAMVDSEDLITAHSMKKLSYQFL